MNNIAPYEVRWLTTGFVAVNGHRVQCFLLHHDNATA